jgi:phenylalanyl-tRNA synthetase alpha chain
LVDVTLPGHPTGLGRAHPITQILREMRGALRHLGFHVVEGREVESDEFCFELLNMPTDHPARDMQDTFYIDDTRVLRTHTSAAQVRYMRRFGAPLRVAVPGKCFRVDKPDPSHNWMFHQMEGFVIGERITLADLKGTVAALVARLFGPDNRLRFRGSYFPYTEPSLEVDLACTVCSGAGCRLCGDTGWLEIIPGGMIHPVVLRNGGIDPARYTGFAFGAGPDRIAALKYRVDDIRYLYENDLRFVEQF